MDTVISSIPEHITIFNEIVNEHLSNFPLPVCPSLLILVVCVLSVFFVGSCEKRFLQDYIPNRNGVWSIPNLWEKKKKKKKTAEKIKKNSQPHQSWQDIDKLDQE